MKPKIRLIQLTLASAAWLFCSPLLAQPENAASAGHVVPLDWARFHAPENEQLAENGELLMGAIRHCLAWIPESFEQDERGVFTVTNFQEHGIRPACSAIHPVAVAL